jgi:hypothetical protein
MWNCLGCITTLPKNGMTYIPTNQSKISRGFSTFTQTVFTTDERKRPEPVPLRYCRLKLYHNDTTDISLQPRLTRPTVWPGAMTPGYRGEYSCIVRTSWGFLKLSTSASTWQVAGTSTSKLSGCPSGLNACILRTTFGKHLTALGNNSADGQALRLWLSASILAKIQSLIGLTRDFTVTHLLNSPEFLTAELPHREILKGTQGWFLEDLSYAPLLLRTESKLRTRFRTWIV